MKMSPIHKTVMLFLSRIYEKSILVKSSIKANLYGENFYRRTPSLHTRMNLSKQRTNTLSRMRKRLHQAHMLCVYSAVDFIIQKNMSLKWLKNWMEKRQLSAISVQ